MMIPNTSNNLNLIELNKIIEIYMRIADDIGTAERL